jgi:hypothetical protein
MVEVARGLLVVVVIAGCAHALPAQAPSSTAQELDLCAALAEAGPGARIPVKLSGILRVGFEQSVLFDPDQPQCPWDVQPTT